MGPPSANTGVTNTRPDAHIRILMEQQQQQQHQHRLLQQQTQREEQRKQQQSHHNTMASTINTNNNNHHNKKHQQSSSGFLSSPFSSSLPPLMVGAKKGPSSSSSSSQLASQSQSPYPPAPPPPPPQPIRSATLLLQQLHDHKSSNNNNHHYQHQPVKASNLKPQPQNPHPSPHSWFLAARRTAAAAKSVMVTNIIEEEKDTASTNSATTNTGERYCFERSSAFDNDGDDDSGIHANDKYDNDDDDLNLKPVATSPTRALSTTSSHDGEQYNVDKGEDYDDGFYLNHDDDNDDNYAECDVLKGGEEIHQRNDIAHPTSGTSMTTAIDMLTQQLSSLEVHHHHHQNDDFRQRRSNSSRTNRFRGDNEKHQNGTLLTQYDHDSGILDCNNVDADHDSGIMDCNNNDVSNHDIQREHSSRAENNGESKGSYSSASPSLNSNNYNNDSESDIPDLLSQHDTGTAEGVDRDFKIKVPGSATSDSTCQIYGTPQHSFPPSPHKNWVSPAQQQKQAITNETNDQRQNETEETFSPAKGINASAMCCAGSTNVTAKSATDGATTAIALPSSSTSEKERTSRLRERSGSCDSSVSPSIQHVQKQKHLQRELETFTRDRVASPNAANVTLRKTTQQLEHQQPPQYSDFHDTNKNSENNGYDKNDNRCDIGSTESASLLCTALKANVEELQASNRELQQQLDSTNRERWRLEQDMQDRERRQHKRFEAEKARILKEAEDDLQAAKQESRHRFQQLAQTLLKEVGQVNEELVQLEDALRRRSNHHSHRLDGTHDTSPLPASSVSSTGNDKNNCDSSNCSSTTILFHLEKMKVSVENLENAMLLELDTSGSIQFKNREHGDDADDNISALTTPSAAVDKKLHRNGGGGGNSGRLDGEQQLVRGGPCGNAATPGSFSSPAAVSCAVATAAAAQTERSPGVASITITHAGNITADLEHMEEARDNISARRDLIIYESSESHRVHEREGAQEDDEHCSYSSVAGLSYLHGDCDSHHAILSLSRDPDEYDDYSTGDDASGYANGKIEDLCRISMIDKHRGEQHQTERIVDLEFELKARDSDLQAVTAEIDALQAELTTEKDSNKCLEHKLRTANAAFDKVRSEVTDLQASLTCQDHHQFKLADLPLALQAANSKTKSLLRELDQLREQFDGSGKEHSGAQIEVQSDGNKETMVAKNLSREELAIGSSSLCDKSAGFVTTNLAATANISADLDAAGADKLPRQASSVDQHSIEMLQLQTELDAKCNEVNSLREQVEGLVQEKQCAFRGREDLEQSLATLKGDHGTLLREHDRLRSSFQTLRLENEDLKSERAEIESAIIELRQEATADQEQIYVLESRLALYESKANSLAENENAIIALQNEVANLRNELQMKKKELDLVFERCNSFQQSERNASEEIKRLELAVEKVLLEKDELLLKYSKCNEKLSEVTSMCNDYETKIGNSENLQQQVDALLEEKKIALQNLNEVQKHLTEQRSRRQEDADKVSLIQSQLSERNQELENALSENQRITRTNHQLKEKTRTLNSELNDALQECGNLHADFIKRSDYVDSLEQSLLETTNSLKKLQQSYTECYEKVVELTQLNEKQDKIISELELAQKGAEDLLRDAEDRLAIAMGEREEALLKLESFKVLSDKLQEKDDEIKELTEAKLAAETALVEAEKVLDSFNETVARLDKTAHLQGALAAERAAERDDLVKQVAWLKEEVDRVRSQASQLDAVQQELECVKEEKSIRLEEKETKITRLREYASELKGKVRRWEAYSAHQTEQIAAIKAAYQRSKAKYNDLEMELETLARDFNTTRS